MEFTAFPKIARYSRECIITEKIDGTNASVYIGPIEEVTDPGLVIATKDGHAMLAGSRTRWVTPGKQDNAGFAGWAQAHAEELFGLGPGHHFGEWWGGKIQRGYGQTEKRFSLFNTTRWAETRPVCCSLVPELYRGPFVEAAVHDALFRLQAEGSIAAPGFKNPEGIVIYHVAGNYLFKKTLEKDEQPKGQIS